VNKSSFATPRGDTYFELIKGGKNEVTDLRVEPFAWPNPSNLGEVAKFAFPDTSIPRVDAWRAGNRRRIIKELLRLQGAKALGIPHFFGTLWLTFIDAEGRRLDLGCAGLRVVTTAGCNKIVAVMNGSDASTAVNFKSHGLGTGSTAEASSDAALVTELTTQYNPDSTRATGTQTTGGSANVYRTVGTVTVDGSATVQEHGVFSQAAVGSGTLLDRTLFTSVGMSSGDGLQLTYDFTQVAGG
jgi:hypothetical protein